MAASSDTVTNTYSNRRRLALGLQQPDGAWTNAFAWDPAGRLTNVISPASTFTYLKLCIMGPKEKKK